MKNKGFTLIELLVVISIIAVLSIIGISTYQGIQAKTRDSVRKRDLNNLATALEIYFQRSDKGNGKYKKGNDTCQPVDDNFYNDLSSSSESAPKDPQTGSFYCYISNTDGSSYTLCAKLENPDPGNPAPSSCTGYNYGLVPK